MRYIAVFLLVPCIFGALKFNEQGKFKIVQITDLHLSEGNDKDLKTQELIRLAVSLEKPDLVAVTGDMVSGHHAGITKKSFESYYMKFTSILQELQTPWAAIPGNHDTEGIMSGKQILEFDMSLPYSMTQPNAGNISHNFNYFLPIYDSKNQSIALRLWFLDSGDYNCLNVKGYGCVAPDQVEWFRQANTAIPKSDPSKGKGILFVHIPLHEHMYLYNNNEFYGENHEAICCWSLNTGLFAAIKEQPTVQWVSAGHDHNNDNFGVYDGITLGYGRKTGYGAYGPDYFQNGVRVFEITQEPYSIKTWIRQADGSIYVQNTVNKATDKQTVCCGALQKALNLNVTDERTQEFFNYYMRLEMMNHQREDI